MMFRRLLSLTLMLFCLAPAGCAKPEQPTAAGRLKSRAASKLKVLVVDDAGIAAGLKLLRGEWVERSGGEIVIQASTPDELLEAESLSADLVIYPSRYVGTLAIRDAIRPVRKSVLQGEAVAMDDIYPLVRHHVLRYGGKVFGLTLGESPLLLAGSAEIDRSTTWDQLVGPLDAKQSPLKYPQAVEFLLRGSAYARNGNQPVRWFDPLSMQPLIESPPFAKALTDLTAASEQASEQPSNKLGLAWPSPASGKDELKHVFVALPQSSQVYNSLLKTWEQPDGKLGEQRQVAYFGFAGRTMSVTRSTRNSSSAFKLLQWLASAEISSQLSPRSAATIWFRPSQQSKSKRWLAAAENSDEVAELVGQLLSQGEAHLLPRIPGIDEYLKSLNDEIQQALVTRDDGTKVLGRAVAAWNKITERYGRDQQQVAYRRHLGLDESSE